MAPAKVRGLLRVAVFVYNPFHYDYFIGWYCDVGVEPSFLGCDGGHLSGKLVDGGVGGYGKVLLASDL